MEEEKIIEFRKYFGIDRVVCCYSDKGVQHLANILAYGVEFAQYELWREDCDDLTWEEYLYFLCKSEQMREKARYTILEAQRNFDADQFDFIAPKPEKDGGHVQIVKLFEGKQIEAVVILFLFKAELAHYEQVRMERGETYTLEQYMQDLWKDGQLAAALRAGFEDSIRRLDFREAWIQEGYGFPEDLLDE